MMAENTSIEWTDHTFNPWRGCTKVSPGCANCYADKQSKRNPSVLGVWGPDGKRVVAAESYWRQPLKWNREAERDGVRRRVFCASMADVFEDWQGPILSNVPGTELWVTALGEFLRPQTALINDQSRALAMRTQHPATMDDVRRRLFALIDATPHLDWILLTKRPENIRRMWPKLECGHPCDGYLDGTSCQGGCEYKYRHNVWIGTSVEDQPRADERIPELLKCLDLSPVLFLSCEPLLGPVDIGWFGVVGPSRSHTAGGHPSSLDIDWVIVGGESGSRARPMHPQWARDIRDQCQAAGVPFFFKQWGEWSPSQPNDVRFRDVRIDVSGRDVTMTPGLWDESDATMFRVGKKLAGRALDGREWSEFPGVVDIERSGR